MNLGEFSQQFFQIGVTLFENLVGIFEVFQRR